MYRYIYSNSNNSSWCGILLLLLICTYNRFQILDEPQHLRKAMSPIARVGFMRVQAEDIFEIPSGKMLTILGVF